MCVVFILRARIALRYGRRTRAQMARWPSFVRAPTERSSAFSLSGAACPFALPCLLLLRERRTEEGSVQDLQRDRGGRTTIGAHYRRCGASVAHLSKQAGELCCWGARAAVLSLHVSPLSTFFLFFLEEKERKCLKKKRNIGARCGQHLYICTEAHAQRTEGKNPATSLIRTLYFGSLLVRPFVCERSSHSLLCCIAVAQKAAVTPDALSGRQQGEFALQLALPYCSVSLAICLFEQDAPAQLSDPTGQVCIGRSPVF